MEGLAKNDLVAGGNVKIELIGRNGKVSKTIVQHNTATINLCELVADALIGNPISGRIPGFIVPIQSTTVGSVATYKNLFSFGIPYQTLQKVSDDSSSPTKSTVELTFLIQNVFLSVANDSIDGFRLLGVDIVNNERPILAEIVLDKPISIKNSNVNLKVTWNIDIAYTMAASV